jgi:3'(2'), 5'-bisphosphate nucleotidase
LTKPLDRHRLLDAICRAARAAGTAILEVYATDFAVRGKADASPVTEADERAERIIVAALRAAAPDIPIVAEEEVAAGGLPSTVGDRFWLVDPLDGTKEFISRNGEFTVNIGLVEGSRAVMGVVHAPALGVTYAAAGAGTATRQFGSDTPAPIAARPIPATGAIVVHSRSHSDPARLALFLATLPGAERRVSGSSIKFCLIAAGEADYYPRFGTTMEWDTAAGQAVLEAAGGRVLTTAGIPLAYGKPDFRNPDFIARGRG